MKIIKNILFLILLSIPITSYALSGWKHVSNVNGKSTLAALKNGACLWVNTSNNGKITHRYKVISKRKGELVTIYQNQRVSSC
ncbi:hypothetical protein [Colwellia sp. 12G3]|uniref:hypothetical protein n=1 Tax=Colwellia sp. 12G3 TaxID=2058299 RepID=UPI000C336A8A|nr:hypothetical protein [Colwellia sp. 12G3]PKI12942.1 hypothetical protein CXF71_19735 [Colwellia sp. 12G3]